MENQRVTTCPYCGEQMTITDFQPIKTDDGGLVYATEFGPTNLYGDLVTGTTDHVCEASRTAYEQRKARQEAREKELGLR